MDFCEVRKTLLESLISKSEKSGYVTMDYIVNATHKVGMSICEVDKLYDELISMDIKVLDSDLQNENEIKYKDPEWFLKLTESDVDKHVTTLVLTKTGCLGRIAADTFRAQNRGGRGKKGIFDTTDQIKQVLSTDSHNTLLVFTNEGKIHNVSVFKIADLSEVADVVPGSMLITIREDERATSIVPIKDYELGYLVMATKYGIIKRIELSKFVTRRKTGIMAIDLYDGDDLVSVIHTSGDDEVVLVTKRGKAIRFHERDVRDMGRLASGVRGIDIEEDDVVVMLDKCTIDGSLLVISEKGYGKTTKLGEYRMQNRGGKGISTYDITDKTGLVASAAIVNSDDDVMILNSEGIAIRIAVSDFQVSMRQTSGALMMRIKEGQVTGITRIPVSGHPEELIILEA